MSVYSCEDKLVRLNEKVEFKRPTTHYRKNSISCGALLSGLPV